MDLIKKTNIDFVTKRNFFLRLSIMASVIGLIVILLPQVPGLGLPKLIEPGIDFTGGTQTTVSFANKFLVCTAPATPTDVSATATDGPGGCTVGVIVEHTR